MAKIRIDPSEVQSAQAIVAAQARAMSEIYAQIGSVDGALDMTFSARADVSSRLTGMRRTGMTGADKLSGIATAMGQAVDNFVQTDQNVAREASGVSYLLEKVAGAAGVIVREGADTSDIDWSKLPSWARDAFSLGMWDQNEKARLLGGLFGAGSLLTGAITLPPGITQGGYEVLQEALRAIQNAMSSSQTSGTPGLPTGGQELYEYLLANDPRLLFSRYNDVLGFMDDVKWYEVMGYGMTNAGDVLKALLKGGSAEGAAAEMMNDPDKCKAILRSIIDDLTGTEYLDVIPSDGETVLKNAQKLAEMAGYDDMADMIEMFEQGTGYAEYADRILKDYSQNIEMLESLKGLAPGSSMLNKHVDNLIREYQNQFQTDVVDVLKSNVESGVVKGVDAVLGSQFGMVTKILDKTLGQTGTMQGLDKVIVVSEMRSDAIQSFQKAVEKIQSGSFTEADMTNYQNSFNVAKSLTIEQYKGMLEYYGKDSADGRRIADKLSQLESMTCQNYTF